MQGILSKRNFNILLAVVLVILFSAGVLGGDISPFSGLALKETRPRPIMAIIDNNVGTEIQAGLDRATIVYEYPVEGGITRLLALFYDKLPSRIGPIRSARPYLINKAKEYNALLLHAGASPQGYEILENTDLYNLDEFHYPEAYWRDEEGIIPHNLYTGWPYLEEYIGEISRANYSQRYPFLSTSLVDDPVDRGMEVTIKFSRDYEVKYGYEKWEGYYHRYVNGKPHILENRNNVKVDNLIIQFVQTEIADEEGRMQVFQEGSGPMLFFRDGRVIEGIWLKVGPGWTSYLDNNGRLIGFNAGVTWVEMVPLDREVIY